MTEPVFLLLDEVVELQAQLIAAHGGDSGLRDAGLLDSALAQPQATFGGAFLHEDVFHMAAAYAYHLCANHAFLDGNKRIAIAAAEVFLGRNGHELAASDEELFDLILRVAQGAATKPQVAEFFRGSAREVPREPPRPARRAKPKPKRKRR